jgi:outer membrane protein OmpA-like peptidoglycan-associated protein
MTVKNRGLQNLLYSFATASAAVLAIGTLPGCALGPEPKTTLVSTCATARFPIYFAKGSDELSDQARAAIRAGADLVRTCQVREVDIFGLAEADGPAAVDLDLSKRRAANVAQALQAAGLPEPLFDVKGLGASTARTATGRPEMLQRKTLVVIQVASASPTS